MEQNPSEVCFTLEGVINMRTVGLKVLLQYGHFFQFVVAESKAREIIEDWKTGKLMECIYGDVQWGVKVDAILCMHILELESLPQQVVQQGTVPGGWRGVSGM